MFASRSITLLALVPTRTPFLTQITATALPHLPAGDAFSPASLGALTHESPVPVPAISRPLADTGHTETLLGLCLHCLPCTPRRDGKCCCFRFAFRVGWFSECPGAFSVDGHVVCKEASSLSLSQGCALSPALAPARMPTLVLTLLRADILACF